MRTAFLLTLLLPALAPAQVTQTGEYLAKIYLEVKRRPAYFVEKTSGGLTKPLDAIDSPASGHLATDMQREIQ